MKRVAAVVGLLAMVALGPVGRAQEAVHIVMISIDGLMPSTYTAPAPARVPTLRKLAAEGAYATGVVGVLPSLTYPSHITLITGVRPAAHGIYDNRIVDPEGRSNTAWYWYARDIRVPTLVGAARTGGRKTAALNWPASVAMEIDYLVPEYWRSAGSDHPETLKLLRALSIPRNLIDDLEKRAGQPVSWPVDDAQRARAGAVLLKAYRPTVLLLHLLEVDAAQHDYGPGSPEALAVIERADGYVAAMLQAVIDAGISNRTHFVVVSDHGFLPVKRQLQVNALFKQEGLITVNVRGTISAWDAYFHASGGSGYVFLKDPTNAALKVRVQRLLEKLAANPDYGIEKIWTEQDLIRLGAQPGAAFGIDMRSGFYTGIGHNALMTDATNRGAHGFDPTRPELHASFIATGPAFNKIGNLGVIRMTQIAPTLARLLGVSLSPQADAPLKLAR